MAKRAAPAPQESATTTAGETTSGYFRRIFAGSPDLLEGRSNDELLKQWLTDHPDQTEVSKSIKQNLANIKSVLRNKQRKKAEKPAKVRAEAVPVKRQQPR